MSPDELNPEDLRKLEQIESLDDLVKVWNASEPIVEPIPTVSCHHRRFNIDTNSRRVYCRDCDQEVDALTALIVFTTEWSRYKGNLERMQDELRALAARVEGLKREERNTKARLARAQAKEGKAPARDRGSGD
jgi:hypothetical protein